MPPATRPHISSRTRRGRFQLKRITISKRLRAKLKKVKLQLERRRHWTILPHKGAGLAAWCAGTWATTQCPATAER